jgi:hypothetical protein
MAHAGGFISGALTIGGLLHYYPSLFNQDYIEEDQDHNPRQEALAIIYKQVERYQFKEAYGALNEFITQYGSNFDLSLLRYNLGKINNENTTKKDAIALCKTHRPSIYETEKLATLWQENLELQTTLDDSSILKLGLAFSNLPNPAIAEAIFEQLNENKVNDPSLGILARKLAAAFTKKNMPAKKQHYDTIADTLLARSL